MASITGVASFQGSRLEGVHCNPWWDKYVPLISQSRCGTADDMGLGKTLAMLSLVVANKSDPSIRDWLRKPDEEGTLQTAEILVLGKLGSVCIVYPGILLD